MKRLRGACKGCKCAEEKPDGVWVCKAMPNDKRLKKPPQMCEKRIEYKPE